MHATISDMVGGHFLALPRADDRTAGGLTYRETIEEMDRELTEVIEDFGRAVDVEALRLAKEIGKRMSPQPDNVLFSVVSCRAAVFA